MIDETENDTPNEAMAIKQYAEKIVYSLSLIHI